MDTKDTESQETLWSLDRPYRHHRTFSDLHVYALYAIILSLCAVSWHLYIKSTKDPSQMIYSPASEAVEYELVDFGKYFMRRNDYMGMAGPIDETDALWKELYDFNPSGIPRWQNDLLVNRTEPIPGTDIYLVELDVFHQLHCLDSVRQALFPDRYGQWEWRKDGTVETGTPMFQHWEHCIDTLRQTLMCHADIHPLQYRINLINGNLDIDLSTRHTCRNFDKIRDWAKQRKAPPYEWHVAQGLSVTKPDITVQDIIDSEVWREPGGIVDEI